MRNLLKLGLLVVCLNYSFGYQIGIKTRHPIKSGSLVHNSSDSFESREYNYAVVQQPVIVDENWKFLNETRSKMATGICYDEVPTASLVRNLSLVPAGNGSDSTMSRIQVCCDGYERNVHNFYKCDPICSDGCPNGICVAPNTCVCYPGHIRNLAQFCIPTCPIGCGNGECESDGSCKCKPGYTLDILKKFCVPVCSHGCVNGNCTEPDICQCNEGYRYGIENGRCEPKCDDCEFGKCTSPGVCECLKGYQRVNNKCEPICSRGCNQGICSAPETCTCRSGFTLDKTGVNCVAHCDQPCINGLCDGPNKCACNPGYILDETTFNICKPHCPQGCNNGFCTSPNFCVCKYGYVKTGVKGRQQCTPV